MKGCFAFCMGKASVPAVAPAPAQAPALQNTRPEEVDLTDQPVRVSAHVVAAHQAAARPNRLERTTGPVHAVLVDNTEPPSIFDLSAAGAVYYRAPADTLPGAIGPTASARSSGSNLDFAMSAGAGLSVPAFSKLVVIGQGQEGSSLELSKSGSGQPAALDI